jgi:Gpi18-like mannosyltransferase
LKEKTLPLTRLDWALIAALALAAIIARALPGPRTIDDAYITFRYARNIAEGVGFVYNPGQRVLGTTTTLFAALMALIGFLTGSEAYPTFALIVSAFADAATCALLFLLARRVTGSRAAGAVLGLLWAVAPMSVTFAIGGMETSVFILLMVATFWLYVAGRERLMAVTAALGVLTRPDAVAWAGLIFLHQLWARFRARVADLRGRAGALGDICARLLRLAHAALGRGQSGDLYARPRGRPHPPDATLRHPLLRV